MKFHILMLGSQKNGQQKALLNQAELFANI